MCFANQPGTAMSAGKLADVGGSLPFYTLLDIRALEEDLVHTNTVKSVL